jgi:predicted XRE-type DNA-binding protein
MALKRVTFHGDSLARLRDFPEEARREAGHELYQVQNGRCRACAACIREEDAEDSAAGLGARRSEAAAAQARIAMTRPQTYANVWDALEDRPNLAATMTMRSEVMIAIKEKVRSWDTTQAQAARRLGITQPRLNDLLHGKINKFSLDTLMTLATRAGLKVKIAVRSAA